MNPYEKPPVCIFCNGAGCFTCGRYSSPPPIIEPTEHVQLPTQIVYVGAKPPDIPPVKLDCSGMLPKGAEENLAYGEQVMQELKAGSCTCDAFCEGSCPVHGEEMRLQDERITRENGERVMQELATTPFTAASLREQLVELSACIIRCGDPEKAADMLELLIITSQAHALDSILRERG